MLVGVVVVAVTAVIAKMSMSKKKKAPITLKDPEIKYPLKLVDKEVRSLQCSGRQDFWSHEALVVVFISHIQGPTRNNLTFGEACDVRHMHVTLLFADSSQRKMGRVTCNNVMRRT